MKLWNDLRGWAGANAAALRLCFRMTVAGLLAYVLAELFALPQGYWAVFSAVIVMQASVGGSVKATIDRVIGTSAVQSRAARSDISCPTKACFLSASPSSSRSCR